MLFILKAAISGIMIALVATIAKRQPALGALIASLPLISVMGMIWLWEETHNVRNMEAHVYATFWYVVPSLPMFLVIPALMRSGFQFYAALGIGCVLTVILYSAVTWIALRFGFNL